MNPSMAIATVLIDELIRHGIKDLVLCPGSRSAPLAYAAHEADAKGRLRLHVRVDERSAGFLALGLGKVTRVPVPVVTTSGTAAANLYPAVLEAAHAAVPLIVMTADRPPELRGLGANQTTDQVKLFGASCRWFHEPGAPDIRGGQNANWRSVIGRAVAESEGLPSGDAGPVHLNIPLREPLVPTDDVAEWPESLEGRPRGVPWLELRTPGHHPAVGSGPGIAPVPRTLVMLGDLPNPSRAVELSELADVAGWPLIAEPFGRYHRGRSMPHGSLILQAEEWLEENRPERVLVGGRLTLSRPVQRLLAHPDTTVEAVTALTTWADPGHVVRRVHDWADVLRSHDAVSGCVDRQWASRWRKAGSALVESVGDLVAESWPSGPAIASTVVHHAPMGSHVYVGSSNTARDLEIGRNPSRIAKDVLAVSNRGLAGIDGVLSSAIGLALSRPDSPTFAIVGDLTFLHDSNAFLIGPNEPRPDLTIVVLNDDGGGIFGVLEPGQAELAGPFERIFATPTGTRFADLCAAHDIEHELVSDVDRLAERIMHPSKGIHVVEVRMDRAGQRDLRESIVAAATQAVLAT
ncbi:2-succinyl-5-enolpyruvyl-6-hydroxy-3-cyclohexene-1-carboxylic-acid synthase [Demetria terragena]|uniref:2-succinyl-5-enolpyruvyl-6-hydroxy-3- cyclohexene-1-carboxylic-acid synthase n=1 Tax=Demetria terragena TaxID=63959 RepID=UPI00039B9ED9|nr:2-succinyl-5-enolpyruvyl-6-hydroxy-3-cyclohexene-1-carboxylic-acid synthase [Demetria terragena]